jgi:[NiFe] hydrogenase assembly HybE family chaperone
MTESAALLPDPSPRLEAGYRAAHERIRGLPFVNPALRVEAVAFAPWEDRWLGVLVTPWCMNLVLAPRARAAWQPLAQGVEGRYTFPAGAYVFIGAADPIAGEHQICSLFSPVLQFDDHDSARLVAILAREALLDPAHASVDEPLAGSRGAGDVEGTPRHEAVAAPDPAGKGPIAQLQEQFAAPLSKRDFLRARFLGGNRDDRG